MSEELGAVVDPDVTTPPADAPPPPEPIAVVPEPPPQQEEDIPEAVEVQPGVRVVPVGVVKAQREEIKALKAQAQRVPELEQQVNQFRPYVEFLQHNPQLLTPQPQPPPAAPGDDPALVDYARTLDLYTQDGRPDTARAAKLRDMTRSDAQAIAQHAMAPMQEATNAQAAAQNLQWMINLKDANGRQLEEQYIVETVKTVYGNMSKAEAIKLLADPNVAQVLADTALGRMARAKPHQQAAPLAQPAAPLHVESAGGNAPIHVSEDHTKRLGVGHKQYVETAKRYVPGRANSLE